MKLVDKPLTEIMKKFSKLYVDSQFGNKHLTNTDCAIQAGYSPGSAYTRAYELLNPKICPHVVKYIGELKEDFRIKNNIDPDKHMARLNYLGQRAEAKDMIGVSLRAEELRGKVAGYYIDRIIQKNKTDSDLTIEEIEEKQKPILDTYDLITSHEKEEKNATTKPKRNGKVHKRIKSSD